MSLYERSPVKGLVSKVELLGGDGAFKGQGLASGAYIESLPSTGIVGHWPLPLSLLLPHHEEYRFSLPHGLAMTWL